MTGSPLTEYGGLLGREAVRTSLLPGGGRLPCVIEPAGEGVALAAWCAAQRDWVETLLHEHGAILFRGFDLPTVAAFEQVAKAACGELFAEYGDLPRNQAGEKIYESTPYPADQMILWHNESAHLPSWPMRISFYCVTPATSGGCTPIIDTRALMHQLDPGVIETFRSKGLMYVRNFSDAIEPTWEQFFHTGDRAVVEQTCRDAGSEFEWRPDGSLRIIQRSRAVMRHPVTHDDVFFNQLQHHHIACVDEETRDGLRALFDDDALPRHVYYGDGSPIPDEVMEHIGEVYQRVTVRFTWRKGDMIMLDNMLTSHARDTFSGPRHIVVAMSRIVHLDQLPA